MRFLLLQDKAIEMQRRGAELGVQLELHTLDGRPEVLLVVWHADTIHYRAYVAVLEELRKLNNVA